MSYAEAAKNKEVQLIKGNTTLIASATVTPSNAPAPVPSLQQPTVTTVTATPVTAVAVTPTPASIGSVQSITQTPFMVTHGPVDPAPVASAVQDPVAHQTSPTEKENPIPKKRTKTRRRVPNLKTQKVIQKEVPHH